MDDALRHQVRQRANHRCEYCQIPQSAYDFTFPIDHVIARQHKGQTTLENLALCCTHCNRYKGPNVGGIDTETSSFTRLFHPRRDLWHQHFKWDGPLILGLTDVGRVTVEVLAFNNPSRVAARAILIDEEKIVP